MRSGIWRWAAFIMALMLLAGCGKKTSKQISDNMVSGFLFNFDQRAETASLAAQIKKDHYPVKIRWCYDPTGETKRVRERETEDQEKIEEICRALANAIILDNAFDLRAEAPYYIILTNEDGSECRFDFVNESTIRLSEQNYSIESDGNLWPLLTGE